MKLQGLDPLVKVNGTGKTHHCQGDQRGLHRKEEVVMIIHVIEFSSSEMLNIILILEGYSNYSIV